MATARITCPECKSVLRPAKPVPDGKKVRCPKCGNLFITPGLVEDEEERPRTQKSSKKAPKKKEKVALKKGGAPKPPPKKHDFDDDEESGGIYSFVDAGPKKEEDEEEESKPYIEYAPDMSIKDLRGPAQAEVVKPSNYIMLIGGLSALANLFLICWSFWPMIFSDSVVDYYKALKNYYQNKQDMSDQDRKNAMQRVEGYKEFKDLKDKDLEIVQDANEAAVKDFWVGMFPWLGRLWLMGFFIFVLIYNAIAIIGAVKVQNLESRRWGIASSIMMLFPPACGGLSCLFALAFHFLEDMTGFLGEVTQFYMIVAAAAPYVASLYIGVMSLRTLMDQKVIDGFEYVAD
jgi:predicted Zn finger-like uncharacterized protein